MLAEKVSLDLSRAEALVLFELLARYDTEDKIDVVDQAEQRVLWNLSSMLEKLLTEPFLSNYAELLAQACEEVRDQSA